MVRKESRIEKAPFERLYARTGELLERFGMPDSMLRDGDYCVHGDYWGHSQIKVSIHDLALLRPDVIKSLQRVVTDFPGWEIVIAVAVRGHYDDWPDMGLKIRAHEIIDGLQRRFFPKEFQNIQYEGSRMGTERD